MDHKYKSLLQNIPTRHIIAQIEDGKDGKNIQKQLTRFRDLDIVNYFALVKLSVAKALLDSASNNKFFGRKFAWHIITQVLTVCYGLMVTLDHRKVDAHFVYLRR